MPKKRPRLLERGRRDGRAQGLLGGGLADAVGRRDLVWRAVARHDAREHVALGVAGVRAELGPQVLLRVVQRVLDQRRVGAVQGGPEGVEVLLDGAQCGGRHGWPSWAAARFRVESTKSRVVVHVARQAASASRPAGVIR